MWEAQIPILSAGFRVVCYDSRGHGDSSAPQGPYTITDLGRDALAVLDALQIERAHFCGLSIGGLVGQWLGINAGARIDKLVLCSTAAQIGTADSWRARIALVREKGMSPLAEATADRWFTQACNASRPGMIRAILDDFIATSADGYCGCCAALATADYRDDLGRIGVPVLTISGAEDPVCPPADLQFIADSVVNGRHISVPGRHLCNLESPAVFTTVVAGFLNQ